jgi:dihydromethanopterin reductase
MADVRAMLAIGQRGQLGLGGGLPWEGNKAPEYREDVTRFFAQTEGHVIAAGPVTAASIPDFARKARTIIELRSHMDPEAFLSQFPDDRIVFIGGGPPVWAAYAPFIRVWDITRLPYDGEADRWFDPAWLVEGGKGR